MGLASLLAALICSDTSRRSTRISRGNSKARRTRSPLMEAMRTIPSGAAGSPMMTSSPSRRVMTSIGGPPARIGSPRCSSLRDSMQTEPWTRPGSGLSRYTGTRRRPTPVLSAIPAPKRNALAAASRCEGIDGWAPEGVQSARRHPWRSVTRFSEPSMARASVAVRVVRGGPSLAGLEPNRPPSDCRQPSMAEGSPLLAPPPILR